MLNFYNFLVSENSFFDDRHFGQVKKEIFPDIINHSTFQHLNKPGKCIRNIGALIKY